MAKHKLSSAAKTKLRADLSALVTKGKAVWSSLVELGKKFRVSPETVRWHLKAVKGNGKPAAKAKAKAKNSKARTKKVYKARVASPVNGAIQSAAGLLAVAERYGEDGLRRAIRATRLIPRWRSKLRKLRGLRRVEAGVRRSIHALTHQADELGRRIRALTKG
jgi:predicted ArsR family transcriptional regulator